MGETEYKWDANDFANIITISGACIASVLLVLFKSRCEKVSVCCGMWACDRELPPAPVIPTLREP